MLYTDKDILYFFFDCATKLIGAKMTRKEPKICKHLW